MPFSPLGTNGIDPKTVVALSPFLIPQPDGVGSLAIVVPDATSLADVPPAQAT